MRRGHGRKPLGHSTTYRKAAVPVFPGIRARALDPAFNRH